MDELEAAKALKEKWGDNGQNPETFKKKLDEAAASHTPTEGQEQDPTTFKEKLNQAAASPPPVVDKEQNPETFEEKLNRAEITSHQPVGDKEPTDCSLA